MLSLRYESPYEVNSKIMSVIIEKGYVRVRDPDYLLAKPPGPARWVDPSKVKAMLLGVAVGDALGAPVEFRRQHWYVDGLQPGSHVTDDTQLTFDTLKVILRCGYLNSEELAATISSHHIVGIGGTVRSFLRAYRDRGVPWYAAGVTDGYGNGALMRVSPVVLPYLAGLNDSPRLEAALSTVVTHRNAPSLAASVAYVEVLLGLMESGTGSRPNVEGLALRLGEAVDSLSDGSARPHYDDMSPGLRRLARGSSDGERLASLILGALEEGVSVKEFAEGVDRFEHSGYIFATLLAAVFAALRHLDDPTRGLIEAVNHSGDSDSVGAVTGALLGAYAGRSWGWLYEQSERLLGWLRGPDDDQTAIWRLVDMAVSYMESPPGIMCRYTELP